MLEIISKTGDDKIAMVYIARTRGNKYLEFVESVQPPILRKDKWVLIVSTLFGCPVGCPICDAGGFFYGKLSKEEIFAQIDHLVVSRFPEKQIACAKFKIQFARMGEPALNPALLDVLTELPERYNCSGLLPSFSTIAPSGSEDFFIKLLNIKNELYRNGNFQMQFSIHTTDQKLRDKMIPIKKWEFSQVADYGKKFYVAGDKKISLNFALAKEAKICVKELKKYFDPNIFLIKITPINPTINSITNKIESYFITGDDKEDTCNLVERLRTAGYEVIISIGELKENQIGSNCGQYIRKFIDNANIKLNQRVYDYKIEHQ